MILSHSNELFEEVAKECGYSSIEVKQVINELFNTLKDMLSDYPETPAFLLNKFANIYLQPKKLKTMISKRIMGDIQKEKWTSALQMAEHYHNTRKLENKHKDERQSDSAE